MELPDITYDENIDPNLAYLLDQLKRAMKKGTKEERQEITEALGEYLKSKGKIKTPLGWITQKKWDTLCSIKLVKVYENNMIQISGEKINVIRNNEGETTETTEFKIKEYL